MSDSDPPKKRCKNEDYNEEQMILYYKSPFSDPDYIHELLKNNLVYAEKVLEYLPKSMNLEISDDWNSTLTVEDVDLKFKSCVGKYMDCKYDEPAYSDKTSFFTSDQSDIDTETQTETPPNECHSNINSVEEDTSATIPDINPTKTIPRNLNIIKNETQERSCTTTSTITSTTTSTSNQNIFQKSLLNVSRTVPSKNTNPSTSSSNESVPNKTIQNHFRTARDELEINLKKKNGNSSQTPLFDYGTSKKSLGTRRTGKSEFVPPIKQKEPPVPSTALVKNAEVPLEDERLRNIDPKMVELILSEIMHKFKPINWEDIAGLEYAKSIIREAVVWPILRPDIFTGLRRPPRGILLFGPPGTGKTLIGKCIASQSKSTFFSISASSLTSKWIGDGEKMVRALFAVAAANQPSVVFIDEIDSLLCQRSETEHESSRRIKTEFLVQLDGAATSEDDRILIVGATNRPQELDEAARRRLVRRLYIPLPEQEARRQILRNLLRTVQNNLADNEVVEVSELTAGYTGADMESLCREASMEPIRSIPAKEIPFFDVNNVRPVNVQDFHSALKRVRASVSQTDLAQYEAWNATFGSGNTN